MRSNWPGCCCAEKDPGLQCLGVQQKSSAAKIQRSCRDACSEGHTAEGMGQSSHSIRQWWGVGSRTISIPRERYSSLGKARRGAKRTIGGVENLLLRKGWEREKCVVWRGDQAETKQLAKYVQGWCKEAQCVRVPSSSRASDRLQL